MDTIGDFLTIIRNASAVGKVVCVASFSNIRANLAAVLKKNGYICDFLVKDVRLGVKEIIVALKYVERVAVITGISRYSRPGCRLYCAADAIPRVHNNLGMCILTTSKGILSDKEALHAHVGGELLCKIW
jgi:small subunit ribosomal protein S8